ncbi:hypothetical protein STRCI_000914 [Streptomyces cinnabarinus]|uniref:Uncharacterized protein n=1 Tax=Streptomyces cinnabarinus TaxID=67287 RepID=A0ABY7K9M5_9ACTN|nr:hypothetical protein [Streptomyces cinnabarinus]WAZ19837.1 hypothetical protein STRCI_000914 [Streptomyces cinnabarinus]
MSDAEGTPVPDFLDRLLARHAPAAPPRPDVARLRPRLPGPFERVEAVRGTAPEPDGATPAAALWPTAAPHRDAPGRTEVRLRTEREQTVVRTERTVEERELSPTPVPLTPPRLRPVTPVAPRAVPEPTRRGPAARGRQERSPDRGPATVPAGRDAPSTTPLPTPLRPTAADTATARDAVRQAAARRPARRPEQVVQVQIGRLEVTAGPAPSDGNRQRSPEHSRPGATLSLADYLTRGRE